MKIILIFSIFAVLSSSKNQEENTESKVMITSKEIKQLSSIISSIQFDSNELTQQTDKDAINLALEDIKVIKGYNFFSKILKNADDHFIKGKCNNCIKVLSQNAVFIFRAIRKSSINTVNLYLSTDDQCTVKNIQFTFYNDNFVNYTSEFYNLQPKSLNTFHFKQNITFEKVHVNATSSNPSLLCLNEFSLLVR